MLHTHTFTDINYHETLIEKVELLYSYIHEEIFPVFQLGLESFHFLEFWMGASSVFEFGRTQIILMLV